VDAHVPQRAGVVRMTLSPLRHFVLAAMLWLPAAFFLWFLLAGPVVWPVARLADLLLPQLLPDAIASVMLHGAELEIETRLFTEAGPGGQQGILVFDVRPLIYAWCLPLFLGLSMATPLEGRQRLLQLLIGLPVLWLIVTWGAVFDVLKLLAFDAGPLGAAALVAEGISVEFVALGYQFGYLILPAVTPVSLWVVMNRRFLEDLVGWSREPQPPVTGQSSPPAAAAQAAPESDEPSDPR
jgi:hypothetical protein